MSDLHPEILTWAGLLAQWMDFARASVAIAPPMRCASSVDQVAARAIETGNEVARSMWR